MISFNLNESEICLLQSICAEMTYVEKDSISHEVNIILQKALLSRMITNEAAEKLLNLLPQLRLLPEPYYETADIDSSNQDWDVWEEDSIVHKRRLQLTEMQIKFSNWLLNQYLVYQKQSIDNKKGQKKHRLMNRKKCVFRR